jgi:EARP and GARP complex-interacting protein 1
MFNATECEFALKYQSRALVAQTGARDKHRWIGGTCSMESENEITILEYDEDTNTLSLAGLYSHPDQVWSMHAHPNDPSLLLTTHINKDGSQHGVTLWSMPGQSDQEVNTESFGTNKNDNDSDEDKNEDDLDVEIQSSPEKNEISKNLNQYLEKQELELVARIELPTSTSISTSKGASDLFVNSARWHPDGKRLLTTTDNRVDVYVYEYSSSSSSSVKHSSTHILNTNDDNNSNNSSSSSGKCCAAWDAHGSTLFLAAYGNRMHLVDTSTNTTAAAKTVAIGCKTGGNILDIDCNPNRLHTWATCGDDRLIRLWDSRDFKSPLKTLQGHTHWTESIQYNPAHDQLLLSGGSDNNVNLWRIASCSSSPWIGDGDGDDDDDDDDDKRRSTGSPRVRSSSRTSRSSLTSSDGDGVGGDGNSDADSGFGNDPADVRVTSFTDQHSESVYSVSWGSGDAWSYCSLSYDGRIVLSHVPSTEKYKILL